MALVKHTVVARKGFSVSFRVDYGNLNKIPNCEIFLFAIKIPPVIYSYSPRFNRKFCHSKIRPTKSRLFMFCFGLADVHIALHHQPIYRIFYAHKLYNFYFFSILLSDECSRESVLYERKKCYSHVVIIRSSSHARSLIFSYSIFLKYGR